MAFVQANHAINDASGTALAVTLTGVVAGNTISGQFTYEDPSTSVLAVSDGTANVYTVADNLTALSFRSATFYCKTTVGGSLTITATPGGACTFRRIQVREDSGLGALDQHVINQSATFGTGADACTSTAKVTTVACTVLGYYYDNSAATIPSAGTGATLRDGFTNAAGDALAMDEKVQGGAGSVAATFTTTGGTDNIYVGMLAFQPAAAAPDQIYQECSEWMEAGAIGEVEHHDVGPWDWYQDNTCPNRADIAPLIPERLPDAFEWIDPNDADEALWQWPMAHAPPPADVDTYVYAQTIHDSSTQLEDVDEDFAFADAPLTISVAPDQIWTEDGASQLEDFDEDFAFADAPRPADVIAPGDVPQFSEPLLEDEPEDFGFADAPLSDDVLDQLFNEFGHFDDPADEYADPGFTDAPLDVPLAADDQIYPELGNDAEPGEEADGFADAPLQEDDQGAQYIEQPVDEEEGEGFSDAPLAEDAPQLSIESAEQPEPDEEVEGFADAPLAEDAPQLSIESAEQPEPDEDVEGFSDAPFEAPPDLSYIPPECSDNQIDTPDDEAFDFSIGPTPDDVAPVAVFPPPNEVLAGVIYGPTGNDYTGTLAATSGGVYLRRR